MKGGYILAFIVGACVACIALGLIVYGIWTRSETASLAGLAIGGAGAALGRGGFGSHRGRNDRSSPPDSRRTGIVVRRLEETGRTMERVEDDLDARSVEANDAATRIRKLAEAARIRKEP
jgi:hypothetical protein